MKGKRRKILITVSAVFLCVIFATLVLPSMLFPLRMNVSGHIFHVGDTMSGTATFTNRSGQDVRFFPTVENPVYIFITSRMETITLICWYIVKKC